MSPLLALLLTITTAYSARASSSDDIVVKLLTAGSEVDRIGDLKNKDFVFDFTKSARNSGQGGFLTAMTRQTFPAVLTGRGAMAIGVLGPCGLSPPHTHPRATEMNLIVMGGPVESAFIMEEGVNLVDNNLTAGMATIFPQGSMHFQQNLGCNNAVYVASFDTSDFGVASTANDIMQLLGSPSGKGAISASFGIEVQVLEQLKIPPGIVLGAQECRTRCGLSNDFNFSSTFKDYALFSNSTWESSTSQSPSPSGSAGPSYMAGIINAALLEQGNVNIPFSQNPLRDAVIGLSVTVGTLFIAVVALLFAFARRRSGRKVFPSSQPYKTMSSRSESPFQYSTPYDESGALTARTSMEKM